MTGVNYDRAQRVAHRQIAKFGGGVGNARISRAGVLRTCTACVTNYTARERDGSLIQFADRRALISPVGLNVPPDYEENDILILGKFIAGVWTELERLRMVAPPDKFAPAGTVIYWDVQVRK